LLGSYPEKQDGKFLKRLINVVILVSSLIALASSAFILVNVFTFAYEAYKLGQSPEEEEELAKKVYIVIYKFLMLLMFTIALLIGSLIPLALMYILLIPVKQKLN
jgi:formate hydrogenlyase subunit 3/multisubunit Na+/H+ antiporter MnhD subunit